METSCCQTVLIETTAAGLLLSGDASVYLHTEKLNNTLAQNVTQ